jgi:ribonuclease P protein component
VNSAEALRGFAAFDRVFRDGRRTSGALLHCMYTVERAERVVLRVGFAVSSKQYHAVRRNRLRRLMREAFRSEVESLYGALERVHSCADLIFLFRPKTPLPVERLSVFPVREDMAAICRRIIVQL